MPASYLRQRHQQFFRSRFFILLACLLFAASAAIGAAAAEDIAIKARFKTQLRAAGPLHPASQSTSLLQGQGQVVIEKSSFQTNAAKRPAAFTMTIEKEDDEEEGDTGRGQSGGASGGGGHR